MAKWRNAPGDNFEYPMERWHESLFGGRLEIHCFIQDCDGDFTFWHVKVNDRLIGEGSYYGYEPYHYDFVKESINRWIATGNNEHLPIQSSQERAARRTA